MEVEEEEGVVVVGEETAAPFSSRRGKGRRPWAAVVVVAVVVVRGPYLPLPPPHADSHPHHLSHPDFEEALREGGLEWERRAAVLGCPY